MVTEAHPSDGELFELWAGGDNAAGSALLDRHFAALFRFFRNKAPDAVEDLIQETMLACARYQRACSTSPVDSSDEASSSA